MKVLFAFAASAALVACGGGGGGSATAVTPSALTNNSATYDGQSVSVTGTAKNLHTRKMRSRTILSYQLCDNACVNVFQMASASPAPTEGGSITVTGMYRAAFGRVRRIKNVIMVMPPGGFRRPSGGGGGGQ